MDDDFKNDFLGDKANPESWFDSIKDMLESSEISPEWIAYLQKIYAYLEIGSLANDHSEVIPPSLIKIQKSGWTIQDYGSRIAVSSGDYAHGLRESDKLNDNASPGYGTIVAQSWNSAQQLVEIARERWPGGANLIGATPFMHFAAGYAAWLANYELLGLSVHESDQLAYLQIKTLLGQTSDLKSDQRPR